MFVVVVIFVIVVFMIKQRKYTVAYSLMYVRSLKGLKNGGTRGEGRQGKIGDEIILSRDHGNGNLAPVSFTESRRLCTEMCGDKLNRRSLLDRSIVIEKYCYREVYCYRNSCSKYVNFRKGM